MIVDDDRCEKSLNNLALTDHRHAEMKAELAQLNALTKTYLAFEYLDAEGSIEQRKAVAHASLAYQEHIKKIHDKEVEFFAMNNERNTNAEIVGLWRTESANARKG